MAEDEFSLRPFTPQPIERILDLMSEWADSKTPDCVVVFWFGFKVYTDKTDRVLDIAERFAPFWNLSNGALGVGAMLLFIPIVLLAVGAFAALSVLATPEPTEFHDPVNWLVVPGANEFLPLAATPYIVFSLLVGMAVHEFGHGIAARLEGVSVEETGVAFFLVIPIAAYVELDQETLEEARTWPKLKVLSAGIANNLWVTLFTVWLASFFAVSLTGVTAHYFGEGLPTDADVLAISIIANTLFWVWFMNLNLALTQAIPLYLTDGSRVIKTIAEALSSAFGVGPPKLPHHVNKAITVLTVAGLLLGLSAPWVVSYL